MLRGRAEADRNIAGKMVAIWTIELDGTVGGFQWASDEIHRPEMASCMQSAISAWRFPPPSGGTVEVSFPFVFQTSEGAAERAKKADEIGRRWLDALRRGDPAAIRQASAFPLLIVGARGCGTIAVARAEDAAAQLSCPLRDRVLRSSSAVGKGGCRLASCSFVVLAGFSRAQPPRARGITCSSSLWWKATAT